MIIVPEKITVNKADFKVVLELKDKKNSSAKVYGDSIVLRVSNKLPLKKQQEHVYTLLSSIKSKLGKRPVISSKYKLDLRKGFEIAGKTYKAEIVYQDRSSLKLVIENNTLLKMFLPPKESCSDLHEPVKKLVMKALSNHNIDFMTKLVNYINKKHFNYEIRNIKFRAMKSKWGVCYDTTEITFNTYLLFCPLEVMEYLIIHELSHIGMMNHSKTFWAKVTKAMPNYKESENWLKKHGSSLLNMEVIF
jgi:predicted metal-dependent hydrolase